MKKILFLLPTIIIFLTLTLVGCEPGPMYKGAVKNQSAEHSSVESATTPTLGQGFQQSASIPADKALIYFYRVPGKTGFAAFSNTDSPPPFGIKANGKTIVTLVRGGYYAYLTEPGQIEFTTFEVGFMAPSSVYSITVDAKAKQAYFIKGAHGKGALGRASLTLVSPEVGANEIGTCQQITQ